MIFYLTFSDFYIRLIDMKYLIVISAFLLTFLGNVKEVSGYDYRLLKVAIIDSGLNISNPYFERHICSYGHQSFTGDGLNDVISHGTNIAYLIQKYAEEGNYCFLIYKYYSETNPGSVNLKNEILAIEAAIKNGAKIINISGGGTNFNEDEYLLVKNHPNVIFVVAAGNNNLDLDGKGNEFYPASYPFKNINAIGAANYDGTKASFSNWGNKLFWESGVDISVLMPDNTFRTASGTSEACAIHTGKLVRKLLNAKKLQSFSKQSY